MSIRFKPGRPYAVETLRPHRRHGWTTWTEARPRYFATAAAAKRFVDRYERRLRYRVIHGYHLYGEWGETTYYFIYYHGQRIEYRSLAWAAEYADGQPGCWLTPSIYT